MEKTASNHLLLIEKVLILKSLNIFQDTPENILAEIAPLMYEEEFEKDTVIFNEGEVGDCLYILYKGKVKISKKNTTLAVLKELEVFGELSLLDSETRSATASADSDCILFKIEQEPFFDLMEARPEILKGIIKVLCKRLRAQNEKSATD